MFVFIIFYLLATDQASHKASGFAEATPRQVDPASFTQTDTPIKSAALHIDMNLTGQADYYFCRLGRNNGERLRPNEKHRGYEILYPQSLLTS
jgi:hypothetical protein